MRSPSEAGELLDELADRLEQATWRARQRPGRRRARYAAAFTEVVGTVLVIAIFTAELTSARPVRGGTGQPVK